MKMIISSELSLLQKHFQLTFVRNNFMINIPNQSFVVFSIRSFFDPNNDNNNNSNNMRVCNRTSNSSLSFYYAQSGEEKKNDFLFVFILFFSASACCPLSLSPSFCVCRLFSHFFFSSSSFFQYVSHARIHAKCLTSHHIQVRAHEEREKETNERSQ